MTAAEARPPLFNHLVASRPDRDGNSFSSTAASVALHAAIIAAAVVVTAQVRAPVPVKEDRPIIITEPPIMVPPTARPAGGGASGGATVAPSVLPPDLPTVIPGDIPKPGTAPVTYVEGPIGLALPASPGIGPKNAINVANPGGGFVAVTVLPKLLNRTEVERAMVRLYPSLLQQAGIGGTAIVWLQLDEQGRVTETQIKQASGQRQLDDAALAIGKTARFSPALNGEVKVKVWIELPVVFSVGR